MEILTGQILNSLDGTAYVVDAQWRLHGIGSQNWRNFALANGGDAIADTCALLGRSVLDFIAGLEVRQVWVRALAMVAEQAMPAASLNAGCDSPHVHRTLRLSLTRWNLPAPQPLFLCHAVVMLEQQRPVIPLFDFAAQRQRDPRDQYPPVPMCSFCQRVHVDTEWIGAEAYYARGGASQVHLTHSVCPDCVPQFHQSLGLA